MKKTLFIGIIMVVSMVNGFAAPAADGYLYDDQKPEKEVIDTPKVYLSAKVLYFENVAEGTKVEIYSVVGSKVKTAAVNEKMIDVSDLNRGVYIVKFEKISQKIVIQ